MLAKRPWFPASLIALLLLAAAPATPARADHPGYRQTRASRAKSFFQKLFGGGDPAPEHSTEGGIPVRHPVVLAHGVVWSDIFEVDAVYDGDYWAGAVQHLWERGVPVIAPGVSGTGSIAERAEALKQAINAAYPRGKVNIVAHSMGGLDARYMITMLNMGHRVASLTTVATPHQGSFYADFAKKYILEGQGLQLLAKKAKLRVKYEALADLSVHSMQNYFNPTVTNHPSVDYFSYAGVCGLNDVPLTRWGAKLVMTVAEKAAIGKGVGGVTRTAIQQVFPRGEVYTLGMIKDYQSTGFDWIDPRDAGRSDGVVSVNSAKWGTYLGEFEAEHLAQIGTDRKVDHKALWETVVRNLSEMGY